MDNPSQSESQEEVSVDILDLIQIIADNLRLLILGPLCFGLLVLGYSFTITPTFTATTTFLPPQQQQSAAVAMLQTLGALGGAASAATGLRNPIDQYLALVGSRSVEDAIIERFDLLKRYDREFKQDARKSLENNTRITSGKDGLIKVEVDDEDSKFAADVANAYVEELSKLLGRLALTEAQQRRALYESQLAKAKDGLVRAETALRVSGISENAVKASPSAVVGSVASLMAQVTAKEVQLGAMRNYLTDSSPEFRRTQSELAALRAQLAKAEKGVDASGSGDYIAKYRDFRYYETLFELLARQYEVARIDESREGGVVQVVDIAVQPERKSRPKKALMAIFATLGAGFFLLIFVFIRHFFHACQRNPEFNLKLSAIKMTLKRYIGRS